MIASLQGKLFSASSYWYWYRAYWGLVRGVEMRSLGTNMTDRFEKLTVLQHLNMGASDKCTDKRWLIWEILYLFLMRSKVKPVAMPYKVKPVYNKLASDEIPLITIFFSVPRIFVYLHVKKGT